MRRVLSPLAWRTASRQARFTALASALCLVVAIALLVAKGLQATRVDFLVVAAVLLLLLAVAWVGTRWSVEAP